MHESMNDVYLICFFLFKYALQFIYLGSVWLVEQKRGRMENQWEERKVGGQKRFGFPSCVFGWKGRKVGGWKTFLFGQREKWEDEKCSLYKLTIMSLLYNIYKKQIYLHSLNNIKININTYTFILFSFLLYII